MKGYNFSVLNNMMILAAVWAQALHMMSFPRWYNAMLSVWMGLSWGVASDKVSQHFKTDADRVLKPSTPTINVMVATVLLGLLSAAALAATPMPIPIVAAIGVLITIIIVNKVIQ